jgi:penicillin-binding protein 1B
VRFPKRPWWRKETPDAAKRPPGLRRLLLRTLGGAGLLAFVTFACIDRSIVHRFERRTTTLPSRAYTRPFTIARGDRVDEPALLAQLARLRYTEVRSDPEAPGQFRRKGNDWVIFQRTAMTLGGAREAMPVELKVTWGKLRRIENLRDGEHADSFALEAEPLSTFYGQVMEERRWTPLAEIPPHLLRAVETVEDRRFRRHGGIDLVGIVRALGANLRAGHVVQGGSTITQQLVKNLDGPAQRTLRRKVIEAAGALALELHYSKDEILEAYLNEVYLGQVGPVAVSGVGDASRFFFETDVRDLDLPRSALLAGMIRNPGGYNPRRHPGEARERRNLVLGMMEKRGDIDAKQLGQARAAPLGIAVRREVGDRSPWVEDYLADAIARFSPEAVPSRSGHSIFTTFDPAIQRAAQEALSAGMERIERRLGRAATGPPEGAIVVLRPADGALLALVGGRDHTKSQYNRATQARRPPGSTFKPFVFLAGLERARDDRSFDFDAGTVLDDEPLALRAGGRPWTPSNFDGRYRGQVTVRETLEQSINVPTVRAALDIGLDRVVEVARRCGIESDLQAVPALALGAEEVTPLELSVAYAALANGGWRVVPHGIVALLDRDGTPIEVAESQMERAVDKASARRITEMLEGVLERGTGSSAASLGFHGVAAGKTGTSNDLRDAWFVGYTPDLVVTVWVGYDDNRPLGLTGAAAALPIWVDLMQRIESEGAVHERSERVGFWRRLFGRGR